MIYLDNAATSWPKPAGVTMAMVETLEQAGGNPGRSGHRLSIAAARIIYDTRESLARFFGVADPLRVIFTGNATQSLNLAIKGLLKPGDRVVVSSMEHNAVMRPLHFLEKQGVAITVVPCAADGRLDVSKLVSALRPAPRLVVVTHASNVVGTLLPIKEIAKAVHTAGSLLLVDAAQTAGAVPIDITKMGVDLLAFTGHKELLGPPGIGGLVLADRFDIKQLGSLFQGGTGSRSDSEEQPDDLPDKYESGTANLVGIAGLRAGLEYVTRRGLADIQAHLQYLGRILIEDLTAIPGVKVFGTHDMDRSVAVISFTAAGRRVSAIGMRLDDEFGILSRVGLHCAPAAHRTIGSLLEGTVRFAPGIFTTVDDIKQAVAAVNQVLKS
jgi:cysteine desulfurase / selenocysteine lyase